MASREHSAARGVWRGALLAACGFIALHGTPVAQTATTAETAAIEGADRQTRLLAGAKAEKDITIYTSLTVQDVTALKEAFETKYGVAVKLWRGASEEIMPRVINETRAGRGTADILLTNGPALEALHREGLLQKVTSPVLANVIPDAIPPHGGWIGTQLNLFVAAANTNLVPRQDFPRSYRDLLDPRWKGKLGVEVEDMDWFAGVVGALGEREGLELFREIARVNGFTVRKGHTLLTNLVAAGEVPLALTNYNFTTEQAKRSGAPLEWFAIQPLMARPNGVGLLKSTARPHAAVLFYDFVLGEAQPLLAARGFTPIRKDLQGSDQLAFRVIESRVVLDEGDKWRKLFQEIFRAPAR